MDASGRHTGKKGVKSGVQEKIDHKINPIPDIVNVWGIFSISFCSISVTQSQESQCAKRGWRIGNIA